MLDKKTGYLTVIVAAMALNACSAMLIGEGSTESPPIGRDDRGSERQAADEALTEAVVKALDAVPVLRPANLGVAAKSGVVTLSGTVSSFAVRDQAVSLANAVSGVSSVNNQIRVKT